ncbi:MAG: hypothetical protein RSD12_04915, partial [Akkermansia sp.]
DLLSIIGFPSLYGGAGAELYHQIPVWEKLGVKRHFIPPQKNVWRADEAGSLYDKLTILILGGALGDMGEGSERRGRLPLDAFF